MSKQIKINIDEEGNVEIKAIGFKGRGCTDATAALEKAMGAVKKRTKTPEYHQQADTVAQQRQGV